MMYVAFRRWTLVSLVLALAMLLTACGGLENQLVGIWTDGQTTLEFKSDQTVTMKLPIGEANGYWKVADKNYVELQFSGLFASGISGIYEVRIENEIMTMTLPNGQQFQLRKFS